MNPDNQTTARTTSPSPLRWGGRRTLLHIVTLGLFACRGGLDPRDEPQDPPVPPGAPTEELPHVPIEDVPDEPEAGEYEAFFDPFTIKDISLYVAEETIQALNEDGFTYQPATFVHDGVELEVGLRLKGDSSYETFSGKPAMKVKFNEFVEGQKYAEVKRIALNNLTGDPAQGREVACYWVWRAGGMTVPSATFARVYVNDEYFGLYALVEGMDGEWVERHFVDDSGTLWAGNDDADFTASGLANFVIQASSEAPPPLTLEQVAAALQATDADFYTVASRVVDMEQYLDFVAFSIATGGTDGYPWHLNDFFVYGDPAEDGRLNFSPWGQDESWEESWEVWAGHGLLGDRCDEDPACAARRDEHTRAVLERYETLDVRTTMTTLFDLTREAMAADPRSHFTPAEVEAERALLLQSAETWPARVRLAMGL